MAIIIGAIVGFIIGNVTMYLICKYKVVRKEAKKTVYLENIK
jgi:hypothetical protein